MIKFLNGNMFDFKHECYVNTINCFGAMGAGIAKEFRDRYPDMYESYRTCCKANLIAPGDCWAYQVDKILLIGLAIKFHWKNKARISWAKMAIRNFTNDIRSRRIGETDFALPRIGSKNGGRGVSFAQAGTDNWEEDSELGYKMDIEQYLLHELNMLPDHDFTIYKLE